MAEKEKDKPTTKSAEKSEPGAKANEPTPPATPPTELTDEQKAAAAKAAAAHHAQGGEDAPAAKQVRVIIADGGTLGPRLLVNGDITSDADYVAILGQKGQKKVEAV